jgi:putative NAD(P)-binding protein
MRVFVAGGTGVVGRFLVPALVADGHRVTASTRSAGRLADLAAAGAVPAVMDGLDRDAVLSAVREAAPEVIVHQMTALSDLKDFSKFDQEFAVTNELRTGGTDYLLEAARLAGTRRFIAQSFTGFTNEYAGTLVKTEEDPLNPDPPASTRQTLAAIRHVEEAVPGGVAEGDRAALRRALRAWRVRRHPGRGAGRHVPGDRRRYRHLVVHRDHRRRRGSGRRGDPCSARDLQHRGRRARSGSAVGAVPGPLPERRGPAGDIRRAGP